MKIIKKGNINVRTNAVLMYNFGNSKVVELMVSLYSLRKIYDGIIGLYLPLYDENNNKIIKSIEKMNVNIHYYHQINHRKALSLLKPHLIIESEYDNIIMCDSDLLFLKDFSNIWHAIKKHELVFTQMHNWKVDRLSSKIKQMSFLTDHELTAANSTLPCINIGVMGIDKDKSMPFLLQWKEYTNKAIDSIIPDEIIANVIKPYHKHTIIDDSFNCSYKWNNNDYEKAKIIHYHGSRGHNSKKTHGIMWWSVYNKMVEEGYNMRYWIEYSKKLKKIEKGYNNSNIDNTIIKNMYKQIENGWNY